MIMILNHSSSGLNPNPLPLLQLLTLMNRFFTPWTPAELLGLPLDLTKAFDTVNHKIILNKLSAFGVVDVASDWFSSFLANRSQVTCCNNAMSNQEPVSTGVAQGSIFGPLLFVIYMDDLPDVLEHCSVTSFADNTVLSFNSKSITKIELKLNSDPNRVTNWMQTNQLTLEIKKSKFMLIPVLTVLGSLKGRDNGYAHARRLSLQNKTFVLFRHPSLWLA